MRSSKHETPGFFIPASYNQTVVRPILSPTSMDIYPSSNGTPSASTSTPRMLVPDSMVVQAPGGALDLSLYGYQPVHRSTTAGSTTARRLEQGLDDLVVELDANGLEKNEQEQESTSGNTAGVTEGKKRRFHAPRRNSKLERLIRLLEDKRIIDEADAYQLEDIKMPRLRNALNIIFITFGVCFLLAVVIVILYTTIAG
ncbi:unnamed protein product [Schistocephalus solidus]|uniref:Membrane protein ORF8 n=1 Tax=Schistocephalus solidus TaxID=70667 RepID=A0A183SRI2_SCHSO|nr:unnamed protein product [Schistocephalus solidus]